MRTYFFGAYTFSLHPPFQMQNISVVTIVHDVLYKGKWYTPAVAKVDYVPYPMSIIVHNTTEILLSIGLNDAQGFLFTINVDELFETLIDV